MDSGVAQLLVLLAGAIMTLLTLSIPAFSSSWERKTLLGGTPKPLTLFTIGVMYLELYLLDQWEGQ